ncbi:hypothetical protein O3P69_006433 [Scylla paramamosain]|uniref:HIT domain-containing protein n=1 Tax=Scylla paramamosain TaxID=85552 RepID=A0AAW0U494_SCYPA
MNSILTVLKGTHFSCHHLVTMRGGFLKSAYSRVSILGSSRSSVPEMISRGFADGDSETKCAQNVNIIEAKNSPTIFDRILDGSIKADIVYEDPECLAFRDVDPQAPKHLLVIPRRRITMLEDAQNTDQELSTMGQMEGSQCIIFTSISWEEGS